jgi:hypothetical protein
MTAEEVLLEKVPDWSEKQIRRALEAAESSRPTEHDDRVRRHRALMERAAALRASQTEVVDAVALVDKARDELGQRAS